MLIFQLIHETEIKKLSPQVKYSISEIDNSVAVTPVADTKKSKRSSFNRHNKNTLSLTTQVIPEISHESQEEEKVVLNNGHHIDCNINRLLRLEQETRDDNDSIQPHPIQPGKHRVISVIEEASV